MMQELFRSDMTHSVAVDGMGIIPLWRSNHKLEFRASQVSYFCDQSAVSIIRALYNSVISAPDVHFRAQNSLGKSRFVVSIASDEITKFNFGCCITPI